MGRLHEAFLISALRALIVPVVPHNDAPYYDNSKMQEKPAAMSWHLFRQRKNAVHDFDKYAVQSIQNYFSP